MPPSPDSYRDAAAAALRLGDRGAFAEQLELAVSAALTARETGHKRARTGCTPNEAYLSQPLTFAAGRLVDAADAAVMMGWEAPLMDAHAAAMRASCGALEAPRLLNVGFGLGLLDASLQRAFAGTSAQHAIVEPHADVLAHARATGWGGRAGVRLLPGRWQDVVPALIEAGETFDAIFYDTYAESYADLRRFMGLLPALLSERPGACFGYFNGAAAAEPFFHAVYCRLAQLDLGALRLPGGSRLRLRFEPVAVDGLAEPAAWDGLSSRYWRFPAYLAPLAVRREAGGRAGRDCADDAADGDAGALAALVVEHLAHHKLTGANEEISSK